MEIWGKFSYWGGTLSIAVGPYFSETLVKLQLVAYFIINNVVKAVTNPMLLLDLGQPIPPAIRACGFSNDLKAFSI